MSKFNNNNRAVKTGNYEMGDAYTLNAELQLYSLAATSMLEDKFYQTASNQLTQLKQLIRKVSPEFVCKLAIYTREKMYLRSVPVVLMVELVKHLHQSGKECCFVTETITRIIKRVDEITEFLSCYQFANSRIGVKKLNKLSKKVQHGIGEAFNSFDEYQFAKYNRQKEITLKDALFLTHPKPKDENQQVLFDKIVTGTLSVPYTWETELSKGGDKKQAWENLINSGKLGYMAMLRNMRNILKSGVGPESLDLVARLIGSEKGVLRSKQMPMRFLSAYKEIIQEENSPVFLEALEKAVAFSLENTDFFKGKRVLIASDVSGSMFQPLSRKSTVQLYDVGLLLSMVLRNTLGNDVTTGIFGNIWKVKNFPTGNALAQTMYLRQIEGEVGYSTHGHTVLEWALETMRRKYDRIVFFTDCQMYQSAASTPLKKLWFKYKRRNPEAKMYFFDLAGHGTTPLCVDEHDVYLISGYSDKVFDMLSSLEKGDSVVSNINKLTL